MANQEPTRGITLKITKPESRGKPKPEYIYLWHRIIGALAALVLVIGLIGYGLYAWLKPPVPATQVEVADIGGRETPAASAAQETDDVVRGPEPTLAVPRSEIAAAIRVTPAHSRATPAKPSYGRPAPGQLPAQVEPELESASQPTAKDDSASEDGPLLTETEELPLGVADPALNPHPGTRAPPARDQEAETLTESATDPRGEATEDPEPLPPSAQVEITENASTQTPVSDAGQEERRDRVQEQPGEAAAVAATPVEDTSDALFRSQSISISSPAVKRFALAQSVRNNEPKGSLADIALNAQGIAPVCSFSEVIGLKGEVLEYRWLHNTRQVFGIRVPVGAARWRSHAQKDIYEGMKGNWRVELRNSAGQLLASANFVF